MNSSHLGHLRVIELGGGVGVSMSGKLLCDLGAQVVKIEPPEGDSTRRMGPFPGGRDDPEASGTFLYLNAGKRSVVLDLTTAAHREQLAALAGQAHLIINGLPPAQREAMGAAYEPLAALNPSLVMLSITPFGLTGPYRDFAANDLILTHAGGWGWLCPGKSAPADMPPIKPFGNHALVQAGLHGTVAALAALYGASNTGRGEHIDQSAQQAVAILLGRHFATYTYSGRVDSRTSPVPYEPMTFYPCRDGFIFLICPEQDQFARLVKLMDHPEWAEDPRFSDRKGREQHASELRELLSAWSAGWNAEDLFHACQQVRVGAAPVYDYPRLQANEHLLAREFFVDQPHPALGTLKMPGAPYRLKHPAWGPRGAAPALGEAGRAAAGLFTDGDHGAGGNGAGGNGGGGRDAAAGNPLPLAGLRVLDLSWVWAGPQCAMMLAMLGAEVIKVESSKRIDLTRRSHSFASGMEPGPNRNGFFNQTNQGKQSICVNLAHPEGGALIKSLAAQSDVVVSNFATGVLERLGLAVDELQKANPALTVALISACGQTGPCRHYVGYGPLISPLAGLSAQTGYGDGEPRDVGMAYGDPNSGVYAALAITAALAARQGRAQASGQVIDISMWEAMLCTAFEGWVNHALGNPPFSPMGNRHPTHAPHNVYRCQGEDAWLAIAAETGAQWDALCRAVGQPGMAHDPRFASPARRKANEDALDALLGEWCARRERWEAAHLLQQAGVPAMPSLSSKDLVENPHFQARGAMVSPAHPEAGERELVGPPWRLVRHGGVIPRPAPCLGVDTDSVLESLLGLDAAARAKLREQGAIE